MDSYEPVCGSAIRRTCSHCGKLNRLYKGRKVYCEVCSHRADVPMGDCDCPACDPASHMRREADYEGKILKALRDLCGDVLGG